MQLRKKAAALGAGVGLMAASVPSFAAIPTEATTAFTSLATDGGDMVAQGWPIVTAVVVGMLLIKLFKKVASRAT